MQKASERSLRKAGNITASYTLTSCRTSYQIQKMNVWTDVTYLCEVKDAPENYIISHLKTLKVYFMNGMMIMEKERLDRPT